MLYSGWLTVALARAGILSRIAVVASHLEMSFTERISGNHDSERTRQSRIEHL